MALTDKQLELKLCPIGFELVQEEHPVEASRSGCNTVFHYCDSQGIRASYAGCLHTIEAVFDGRGQLRPECEAAINAGTCNAVPLRKLELKANRALFFVDYRVLMERRRAQWALDEENSPIQFRRKRGDRKFVPSQVTPIAEEQPQPKRQKPQIEAPTEIQTNIMEQVLKKKVQDDSTSH